MQTARGTSLTGPGGSGLPGQDGRQEDSDLGPGAPRRLGLLLAIAVCVLALDIVTKLIVVATLSDRPPVRLLGGFLVLREDRNAGAAFSLGGPSTTIIFSAIAITVIVFILRTSRRLRSLSWALSLGLLLGGATGNLTDRIFRSPGPLRGFVVDWIQVPHWPVFNLADSAIVCGGALAVLLSARGTRIDGARPAPAGALEPGGPEPGGPEPGLPGSAAGPVGEPGEEQPGAPEPAAAEQAAAAAREEAGGEPDGKEADGRPGGGADGAAG